MKIDEKQDYIEKMAREKFYFNSITQIRILKLSMASKVLVLIVILLILSAVFL